MARGGLPPGGPPPPGRTRAHRDGAQPVDGDAEAGRRRASRRPSSCRPTYDAAFVCDERQAVFAEKLGYPRGTHAVGRQHLRSAMRSRPSPRRAGRGPPPRRRSCSWDGWSRTRRSTCSRRRTGATGRRRLTRGRSWSRGWGRWPTGCCRLDGVEMLGSCSPPTCPVFRPAGCLVLPSRLEPWGGGGARGDVGRPARRLHAGLRRPSRLVLDGYNGAIVSPGSEAGLARAFDRISGGERRQAAGDGGGAGCSAGSTPPSAGRRPWLPGRRGFDTRSSTSRRDGGSAPLTRAGSTSPPGASAVVTRWRRVLVPGTIGRCRASWEGPHRRPGDEWS